MTPTKVISRRRKRRKSDKLVCYHYLCDDGNEYTMRQLNDYDANLLVQWRAEQGIAESPQLPKTVKFDRSRCKRDSQLCKHYIRCQEIRLGLSDEKWTDPGNTDHCFQKESKI